LVELDLTNNEIVDFSPLADMTQLQVLLMRWNGRITDLTPLAGLINLRNLELQNNRSISDAH